MSEAPPAGPAKAARSATVRERSYLAPVLLLMSVYTLGFIDRQIVNILAEPIKSDLHLSDTHIGLLTGLAFTLLYALAGLPIARWAEYGDRRLIVASSLAVWSTFTALCASATSFAGLVCFRAGVGMGEGGCVPAAHSLITDLVPVRRRASAFALFNMAIPIGTLIGMGFGGLLADRYGWRAAFAVLGVPGLLLAILLRRLLPEPRRGGAARSAPLSGSASTGAVRKLLAIPTYRYAVAGGTMKAFVTYGQAPFIASFILRNHHNQLVAMAAHWHQTPIAFLGIVLGLIAGTLGLLGAWLGGQLADRFSAHSSRVYLLLPAVAAILIVPFNLLAFAAADLRTIFALLAVPVLLNGLWLGPVGATIQGVAPTAARATASAFNLLVVNVLGLGLGPLVVGRLSDFFAAREGAGAGITSALMLSTLLGVVTAALFLAGSRTINADAQHADERLTS